MKKRKIGFRIIKTAIAVILSLYVAKFTKSEYPFFAGMTALISMDKTSGNSLIMGRNRVVGTFIGACIGISLSYIDRGNFFLCGIGSIILLLVLTKLNLHGAITVGWIVLLAIMVHTEDTPLFYGFHRTLDSLIGAIVSILVNIVWVPYMSDERLENMTIRLWNQTNKMVNALKNHEILEINSLRDEMNQLEDELNVYHTELLLRPKRKVWVDKLQKHYNVTKRLFLEFEILDTIDKNKHLDIFEFHVNSALKTYEAYIDEFQVKK